MSKTPLTTLTLCSLALALALALASCGDGPVIVGFSGPLEGKYSDLGVQGRNGLQLAIETINAAGGAGGRKLTLISEHDGYSQSSARAADQKLIDNGAQVIVGHMTSTQSVAAQSVSQDAGVLLLSPTTSTPLLTGKKDLFFRVIPASTDWAKGLARHALTQDGHTAIATITDMDNEAYAAPFNKAFAKLISQKGGTILAEIQINSSKLKSWDDAIDTLVELEAPAVQVALSARDLAALARSIRHRGIDIDIYSAMWAYTRELIQAGGKSTEGIIFAVGYSGDNARPEFLDFQKRYKQRFGWDSNFAAAFGYECGMVLAEALDRAKGDATRLHTVLPTITDFPGTIGPFGFDEYGDVNRPSFIVTIKDREFKTISLIGR